MQRTESTPRDGAQACAEAGSCAPRGDDASALRRRLADAEAVIRASTAILIVVDEGALVRLWNDEASRFFGTVADDALGRPLAELVGERGRAIAVALERCRAEQSSIRLQELELCRADGSRAFVGITLNPVCAEDGWRCALFGRDITEQKKLDAQIAHALKLESIGQLAAGIAHEINTPTQFVSDNVRFLQDAFGDLLRAAGAASADAQDLAYLELEVPKALSDALGGLQRIATIVGAMKEFSHPGTGEKVAVDLNRNVESTVTVCRNEWKYVARLELDLSPSLPLVPCLPDELNQVVLNMVVNAAHAIGERYRGTPGKQGLIRVSTRESDGFAELRISDDGAGIPESVRHRVFEPFFTTKPVGKGTGQGLAIARSVVVDKHGGTVDFESEAGVGTTFVVRIPLATPSGAGAAA
jgi:PAS domain S-box-containing protein